MNSSADTLPRLSASSPYRFGLDFTRKHFSPTLILGPLVLKLVAATVAASYALDQGQIFLVFALLCAADAWLLNASGMFAIESLRGGRASTTRISLHALQFLPKVLLSYSLVIGILLFSYLVSPDAPESSARGVVALSFLFGLFLIWSPAFVIGEHYAQTSPKKDDDVLDDEEDFLSPRPRTIFSGKSAIELGFERSVHFASRRFGLTFELIILLWAAKVVPAAVAHIVSRNEVTAAVIEVVVGTALLGAVFLFGSVMFLSSLPKEALSELSMGSFGVKRIEQRRMKSVVFLALLGLAVLSSFYLLDEFKRAQAFPASVSLSTRGVERRGDFIVVTLGLEDAERSFRWLVPEAFRLKDGDHEPLEPHHVVLTGKDGVVLDEDFFKPYRHPITIELYFKGKNLGGSLEYAPFESETRVIERFEPR